MFRDDLVRYIKAGFAALWVETHEELRAEQELEAVAKETNRQVWRWSVTQGFVFKADSTKNKGQVTAPMAAINTIPTLPEDSLIIMRDFHPFFNLNAVDVIRRFRDLLPLLKGTGRNIVFLGPSVNIPNDLVKEITIVNFTLPTREELSKVLDRVISDLKAAYPKMGEPEDRIALLEGARGLTESEAENIFAYAAVKHSGFPLASAGTVRDEKAGMIKKSGLVTWLNLEGKDPAQIGGLGTLKKDLEIMAHIFHHPDKAEQYGFQAEDFPRFIALVGVPGTGKTMVAETIPVILRTGGVVSDFGRLFGSKVGEPEQNTRKRNELVESMAPVVDIWDEAEKGLGGMKGSDQNPWEARVGGTMLTWCESHRARGLLVVATINRQEALVPEMWNRFQRVYFVDLPTVNERVEIFNIHLTKRRIKLTAEDVKALAVQADGYNGREIRNAIQAGMQTAFAGGKPVCAAHIEAALSSIVPMSKSRGEEINRLRQWALDNNIRWAGEKPADAGDDNSYTARPRRMAVK